MIKTKMEMPLSKSLNNSLFMWNICTYAAMCPHSVLVHADLYLLTWEICFHSHSWYRQYIKWCVSAAVPQYWLKSDFWPAGQAVTAVMWLHSHYLSVFNFPSSCLLTQQRRGVGVPHRENLESRAMPSQNSECLQAYLHGLKLMIEDVHKSTYCTAWITVLCYHHGAGFNLK